MPDNAPSLEYSAEVTSAMDDPNIIARLHLLSDFTVQDVRKDAGNGYGYIDLTFDAPLVSSRGFIVGSDNSCAIVIRPSSDLQETLGKQHFSLSFDASQRLIVQDLGSRHGTMVTYDGQGARYQSSFKWIVSGFEREFEAEEIQIDLVESLGFRLEMPTRYGSEGYSQNVVRFMHRRRRTDSFDMSSLSQEMHPPKHPIIVKTKLGEGGFGIVHRWWNASTGIAHVVKQARTKHLSRAMELMGSEAGLLRDISHENIVQLVEPRCDVSSEGYPRIHMEYVREGPLSTRENYDPKECWWILQQCLSALKHLHGCRPPIVHRDIKPSNILVQHRDKRTKDISVKLADLGCSKRSDVFKGVVGTETYMAPEVALQDGFQYSTAVDIWSLGMTIWRLVRREPFPRDSFSIDRFWYDTVVNDLHRQLKRSEGERRDLLFLLATNMLVLDPAARADAGHILKQVRNKMNILDPTGPKTPRPSFDARSMFMGNGGQHTGASGNVPGVPPLQLKRGDMPPPPLPSHVILNPPPRKRRRDLDEPKPLSNPPSKRFCTR